MATRKTKPKNKRDLTIDESFKILQKYLARESNKLINFKNHKKHSLDKNVFRFTIDLMSLDFLISLIDDDAVKNVYWNAAIPPPGGSIDSISLRFKVYVQYHDI
tara:strand:- start:290 stop:601 length:312 start_codon:yes stop_codon:yes gene_type:complete